MPRSLTDKQKVLALTFYEAEQAYQLYKHQSKSFNSKIQRKMKRKSDKFNKQQKYFTQFAFDKIQIPKHDYHSFFNALRLKEEYNVVEDKFYRSLIDCVSMGVWYDVAKQKGFQRIVKVETIDRYKKINSKLPCVFDEDDARDFYKYFFHEEISKYKQPTKAIQKIVGNKVA